MVAPGPNAETLTAILALATRTPDHGKLAPWRFLIVADEQRAALGTVLKSAWVAENPGATEQSLAPLDQFAHQAPALVILISAPVQPSKIPLWEQQLSAGSVAMNLLHAAHAHGFVANWLTGWAAYSRGVTCALGLADDERIVGYFFIGTPSRDLDERPRPNPADLVQYWCPDHD